MQSNFVSRRLTRAALVGSTALLASWMMAGEAAYAQDKPPVAAGSTVGDGRLVLRVGGLAGHHPARQQGGRAD